MNADRKKELKSSYQTKPIVGGVCCIRCSGNNRVCIQATRNIEGLKNRYRFAISTGGSPDPTLRGEWEKYGAESFSFTVLDELQKRETQTDKAFSDDIDALYKIWLEKAQNGDV